MGVQAGNRHKDGYKNFKPVATCDTFSCILPVPVILANAALPRAKICAEVRIVAANAKMN